MIGDELLDFEKLSPRAVEAGLDELEAESEKQIFTVLTQLDMALASRKAIQERRASYLAFRAEKAKPAPTE